MSKGIWLSDDTITSSVKTVIQWSGIYYETGESVLKSLGVRICDGCGGEGWWEPSAYSFEEAEDAKYDREICEDCMGSGWYEI